MAIFKFLEEKKSNNSIFEKKFFSIFYAEKKMKFHFFEGKTFSLGMMATLVVNRNQKIEIFNGLFWVFQGLRLEPFFDFIAPENPGPDHEKS